MWVRSARNSGWNRITNRMTQTVFRLLMIQLRAFKRNHCATMETNTITTSPTNICEARVPLIIANRR